MSQHQAEVKRRNDYLPPSHTINQVDLTFHLDESCTRVIAISQVETLDKNNNVLALDGIDLELVSVHVNDELFSDYAVENETLVLRQLPDAFTLRIETTTNPSSNTSLEGLYVSEGAYCTQCEAEGFRKITYFLDRPDVLAEYTVKIIAPKTKFPYLLSNGNKVASGEDADDKHWVQWHDPYPKPSYLFALVAGDFDLLTDFFTTSSGKKVTLELFVDKGKQSRGVHALDSLKKAMAWDEQVFGLEYDLDIYMIVAVDFFNMGAMENKGLNVFNSKFVLADNESATDEDFFNIESVIAHEYFHNWTGNRVTCRDWFQLSLKEGLTVFRDQQFSADMSSPIINRIKNVRVIREHQFAEDAGPMAHPIRPDEVMEQNNFYTVTVYDKGAEVIRMMHTLLGENGFRKGMDLYFERHDGQAVTCDDFVQAMQDANDLDLTLFRRWYSQSGTPVVDVVEHFDNETGSYVLDLKQHTPATADQSEKQPLHVPVKMQLLDSTGKAIAFEDGKESQVYNLTEAQQRLELSGQTVKPVPVLLANFSAPVKVNVQLQNDELHHIVLHSGDAFSRWDAAQQLFSRWIHSGTEDEGELNLLTDMFTRLLEQLDTERALVAECLTLPSFETLVQQVDKVNIDAVYNQRIALRKAIGHRLSDAWTALCDVKSTPYAYEKAQVDERRLRNVALGYLGCAGLAADRVLDQFNRADNMTDSLGAIKAAQAGLMNEFESMMQRFEDRWQHDALVLDKWFAMHATTERADILSRLSLLATHQGYNINNPNRVRALIGSFAFYNTQGFHAADGSGYRFVTDYLLTLDRVNPQVSARLVTPLTQWQKLDTDRQDKIKFELARLIDAKDLSRDMYEKVSKSLNFAG